MGVLADGGSTRSAIYSSYLHQGRPHPCSDEVAQWLLQERDVPALRSTDGDSSAVKKTRTDVALDVHSEKQHVRCVRRVVVGHQPHADAPLTMQVQGLQVREKYLVLHSN